MIKEYIEKYFNSVNVLGREISSTYTFSKSNVGVCYVYELDDEIVGFINADIFDDRAEIIDLAVLPLYRNRKIGDELLKNIINICKQKGLFLQKKQNESCHPAGSPRDGNIVLRPCQPYKAKTGAGKKLLATQNFIITSHANLPRSLSLAPP